MVNEEDLANVVEQTLKKFPPNIPGGCFHACNFICELLPQCKKIKIMLLLKDGSSCPHCVVLTDDYRVIDTQYDQFKNLYKVTKEWPLKYVFSSAEYQKIFNVRFFQDVNKTDNNLKTIKQ